MPKSKTPQYLYTVAELEEPCLYCEAEPGQFCHRKVVAPLREPHLIRKRDAQDRLSERAVHV